MADKTGLDTVCKTRYHNYMADSSRTRLARIDEQIIDIQYLYQRELDREAELQPERRLLLASRGFKYRLDKLYSQRAALRSTMCNAPTKAMNFANEMSKRETALENAEMHLAYANQMFKNKLAHIAVVGMTIDSELELKGLRREIGAARSLVSSKQRAVNNWQDKAAYSESANVRRFAPDYMPKAELIMERTNSEHERGHAEKQESQPLRLAPAPALSADQEIIARVARGHVASVRAAPAPRADTYKASFDLLNQQPMDKEANK